MAEEDNKRIVDEAYKDFIDSIIALDKNYNVEKIEQAYELAREKHEGQFRESGEPYIIHPIAVAKILVELGMDADTICAALLHDVIEDTGTPYSELKKSFGEDVANLVDGVTKLNQVALYSKEEQQAENIRKMLLSMSKDIRVIIIKLADRLHNMRTLGYRSEEKRRSVSLETMSIFVPLANRLGIRQMKEELEDLAFSYLDPFAYNEIEQLLEKSKPEREAFIEQIKKRLAKRLEQDFNPLPTIEGRVKSAYGIYKKVYEQGKLFDEIYDKYAVRVIVNTVTECYYVLGVVHDMFQPIPNRFKDYISTPKANMYQSLHTTVMGREGIPFEVQIRTYEMHHTAEYGIAAHWKYKEGVKGKYKFDARLNWVRQILDSQQESNDVEDIVRAIKEDLAPEDVFAMTPKGDVISLPLGATVIDFAYAIHTQVGHRMIGAKADKKLVPLDYQIKTGEIIEILTTKDPNHGPNRAWLDICQTNEAKSKIRSWFKKERRDENIAEGKQELEREFKRNLIRVPENELEDFLSLDMKRHNRETLDDFYAAIGYGGVTLSKIIPRLKEEYTKKYIQSASQIENQYVQEQYTGRKKPSSGIIVDGMDNCVVKLSQCCSPLPGDDIIGFITRGHGVSVHKCDCINYLSQKDNEPDRWIPVHWAGKDETASNYYKVVLDVTGYDRIGILADIMSCLQETRTMTYESTARVLKNGNASITLTISVAGTAELQNVITRLKKVEGVFSVERSSK
ncbi:MAG: bifunctional (p)ppGpp synthetase/guanosine-3',5'-bis(diphosphate) 3'-pyrophosphohydrolase [Ruminococcus sp.]|nr:bifunctional (p)ppGpp synthetase/guanosine-3',5'-bis(diphosphate) 3'-pyrophosphohydrolase [Ruminococcus sp.]